MKPTTSLKNCREVLHNYFEKVEIKPGDMHFLCGCLIIDHNKPCSKLKNVLYAFDLRNCQTIGSTRETSTSKSSIHVAFCSHEIETSIIKTTFTDHYTVLFHVKINCKLQSDTEQQFTARLWKTLGGSSNFGTIGF